jgi:DNA (cytosine-5)-methyltransferase 1
VSCGSVYVVAGVYYNENSTDAVAWLRELIKAGLIPDGEVDGRSIKDVRGSDLNGFTRCAFFAGIGGWELALQLAGWTGPGWTASCPCQPFSVAGKGKGEADERHLWPELRRIVTECHPSVILGEQVAQKAGRAWLAGVRTDLEGMGYAFGASDLCSASAGQKGHPWIVEAQDRFRWQAAYWHAHGDSRRSGECLAIAEWLSGIIVGAPHIRQRLYWVADRMADAIPAGRPERRTGAGVGSAAGVRGADGMANPEHSQRRPEYQEHRDTYRRNGSGGSGFPLRLAHPHEPGSQGRREHAGEYASECSVGAGGELGGVGEPEGQRRDGHLQRSREHGQRAADGGAIPTPDIMAEPTNGESMYGTQHSFWSNSILIPCLDGKARRIECPPIKMAARLPAGMVRCGGEGAPCEESSQAPDQPAGRETFPLTKGQEARIMRLRGYGNAICAPLAAEFIRTYREVRNV